MQNHHILGALLVLLFLQACQLQPERELSPDCNRHRDRICAVNALERADRELAMVYQQLADTQEDESVKRLAHSQRDWLKFRDSFAQFIAMRESDAENVELALINQKIDLDRNRSQELNALLPAH